MFDDQRRRRRRRQRRAAAVVSFMTLALGMAWFFESQATTTVLVVRHADPEIGTANPGLSPAGWVRAEELSRVQNQLEAQFVFGLEQVQDRAVSVGNATIIDGDPKAAARRLDRWRAVTASDIQRVARAYLVPENRCRVWVVPAPRRAS